jgi:hypothetical protein
MVRGNDMKNKFNTPDFKKGAIELRFEANEVCIYSTENGLRKLIAFCNMLLENPKQGHVHIEDFDVLTSNSLGGTIVLIGKDCDG